MIKTIESNTSQFSASNQKSITFSKFYQKAPIVIVSSLAENINMYIMSVNTLGFTVEKSDASTSGFHWIAIENY